MQLACHFAHPSYHSYDSYHENGRRLIRIVVEQACQVSRRYLFSAAQKSVTVQKTNKRKNTVKYGVRRFRYRTVSVHTLSVHVFSVH